MRTRREFLAATGVFLAGCNLPVNKIISEPTPEDFLVDLIEQFPTSLPLANETRKYPVSYSRHCLVHILQNHGSRFSRFSEDEITRIQNNIYAILACLKPKRFLNLNAVYAEGVHEENIKQMYELREKKGDVLGRNSINAVDRHFFWGNLEIKAAESKELYDKAGRAFEYVQAKKGKTMTGAELNSLVESVYEEREDFLLKVISQSSDIFAVAPFGAKHAFGGQSLEGYKLGKRTSLRDNIGEWNYEHPGRKFSLIEVIPEGVEY